MEKSKFYITFLLAMCLFIISGSAQTLKYYLVNLKDKNHSSFSDKQPEFFLSQRAIERRTKQKIEINYSDLPVSQYYIDSIQKLGLTVWLKSKWLNAVVIYTDSLSISKLNSVSFVENTSKLSRLSQSKHPGKNLNKIEYQQAIASVDYGNGLNQAAMIGIDKMHQAGFAGQGIQIAVFDGGFNNADNLAVFDSLFLNGRILGTYDFVNKEVAVYEDHEHGMEVLSVLAGYSAGNLIGGAYRSSYYLLKTEDVNDESPMEEFNWIVAAEYADSVGVDIISSSLGYTDFENTTLSHSYSDLNGKKTIAAKAATMASRKGILVCVSAGNDGANPWKYISTPADADSIIAVGAVDYLGKYAYFSSVGPSADGRIKPDLVAKGQAAWVATTSGGFGASSGTSFSSPILTGLAAGYWSEFPFLTNMEVIDHLKRSASQYDHPDNFLGYGIPNYTIAKNIVLGIDKNGLTKSFIVFPNPTLGSILNIKMLDTSEVVDLQVYKVDGSNLQVSVSELNPRLMTLDLHALSSGVYFLKIVTRQQTQTIRFEKL